MDTMLMAIIGAVIVGIGIAVFIIKNRGNKTPPNPFSMDASLTNPNRPKTLAEQQRELDSRPVAPIEPQIDSLEVAQHYFNQADYTNAVTSLKSAIAKDPYRADLQLLLLRSYAELKDYNEFNQAYTALQNLNDRGAISQAANLKYLLDEERSFTEASMPAADEPPSSMMEMAGLDFDIPLDEKPSTTPPRPTPPVETHDDLLDDMDFSFDVLEAQVLPKTQPAPASAPTLPVAETPAVDNSFDLDFDLDTAVESPVVENTISRTAPVAASTEMDLATDFDFPELNLASQPASNEITSNTINSPAFDITAPELAINNVETIPAVSPKIDTSSKIDFDNFDFEVLSADPEPVLASVAPASTPQPVLETSVDSLESDFDFDFSDELAVEPPKPQPILQATPVNAPIAELEMFDFDLDTDTLATDSSKIAATPAVVPNPPVAQPVVSSPMTAASDEDNFDFDFTDDSGNQLDQLATIPPVAMPIVTETPAISEPSLPKAAPTIAVAQMPTVTISSPTQMPTVSITAVTVDNPVMPLTGEMDINSAFAAIKDIDTTQLNIDLAGQYIELGEYDSAKRLLDEITNANPTQQSMVNNLLEKIG